MGGTRATDGIREMNRRQLLKKTVVMAGACGAGVLSPLVARGVGAAPTAPMINRRRYRIFPHSGLEYSDRAIELVGRATVIDMLSPLTLGTLNQVSELLFMAALPFFVVRLGLKRVLLIGMLAWAVRYLCFTQDAFGFALAGLLLHGFCYSFLYVGAYIYGEKKAPADQKASVQSLLTFLLLGVGQMLGAQWEGLAERNAAPAFSEMQIAASDAGVQVPGWVNPKLQESNFRYLDLSGNVKRWMGKDEAAHRKDLGTELDRNQDNIITPYETAAVGAEGLMLGEATFTGDDLTSNFKAIAAWKAGKQPDELGDDWQLTRDDYIAAQRTDWARVFFIPSLFIFAVAAVFLILGKEPKEEDRG